jgi:magnesium transporter
MPPGRIRPASIAACSSASLVSASWAAIIAVPALVTGYYGMNVPYPGSGHTWGVVASTALMVAACAGLFLLFRRNDWL